MKIPSIRDYVIEKLDRVFNPKTVAVIGASRHPGKIGHQIVRNLLDGGFQGKIYPVNPHTCEILGLECYKSVNDIPDDIDLVVISIPAKYVEDVVKDCAKKNVGGIVIISSGFSEVGNRELEDRIVKIAREAKIPIIGPNVVGVLSNSSKLNASFAPKLPYPGKIALISQSGALIIGLIGWTWMYRVGLSKVVSIGNKADVDFSELILYFGEKDPDTRVIAIYMEGTDAGRELYEAAKRVTPKKPIVILKAGFSQRGELAVASHTGSLAGSSKIYAAAFKQAGVIMVENLVELYDKALALSLQPVPKGDNIVVITNGGGAGVLSTDAAEKYGFPLKDPPEDLKQNLKKYMPEFGSAKNPVDLTGMATEREYREAIIEALKHPWTHGVVVLYCHTAITDPKKMAMSIFDAIKKAEHYGKPVIVNFIGGQEVEEASNWLKERGVPTYPTPYRAMNAMSALVEYGRYLSRIKKKQ